MRKHINGNKLAFEDCITVQDKRMALIIAVLGGLVLLPCVFWGLPFGKSICGALRILDGQLPYRDFWTMYAPGQFYAIAGLFWIFGPECLVQGITVVLINGAIGGVIFLIALRAGIKHSMAVIVSFLIVVSFWLFSKELTTYPPSLLCVLIAIERVLCYFYKGGLRKLFCAGLLLGIAACFKHDVAFYVMVAILLTYITSWFGTTKCRCSFWNHPIEATFAIAGGAAVIVLPVICLLALFAGKHAWQNLIIWPATDFRAVRTEAYPGLMPNLTKIRLWINDLSNFRKAKDAVFSQSHWILCNMPQYIFIIAICSFIIMQRRMTSMRMASSLMFITPLPLFWIAAHVQPNTHVYSMAIFSLCLMTMAWLRTEKSLRQKLLSGILGIGVAIYAIGLIAYPISSLARIALNWSGRQYLGLPGARGIWVSKEQYDVYYPIVSFIHKNVAPDEKIYIGLKRHDSPVINDLRFYYLTGRKNCCRYDELHPGIADRADVQQDIINDMERCQVRCVIIWCFGWSDSVLDKIKSANMEAIPDLGKMYLDSYISKTFQPIGYYGEYILMWRKSLPIPEPITMTRKFDQLACSRGDLIQ